MSSTYSDATPGSAVQYVYMFEKDKGPTKQLDALLRAIARHVMLEIGDRADTHLTPSKLAAFYKAVGGNYDSLFVDAPHSSISYIWQVTGCQHTLQPTGNDFEPPSIPALTFRGFSRWESLEILLGPEEHVPFLQYAVKNWNLKHPETGEDFPIDLPLACFPAQADREVDHWHKTCAAKLWTAASKEEGTGPKPSPAAEQPEARYAYVHVRQPFSSSASPPRHRQAEADYFGQPMPYAHVPRRYATQRKTERSPDRTRREATLDDRARRKSFSDYAFGKTEAERHSSRGHSPTHLDPNANRQGQDRRHSHPRHYSESSDDEHLQDPKEKRRRHGNSPPPPSVRRFVRTSGNSQAPGSANGNNRPHRLDARADEAKRRNGLSPLGSLRDKFTETVTSILPNGMTSDRPRAGSRQNSGAEALRARKSREQVRASRLSRSYSDIDSDESEGPTTTESELRRRRKAREERERDRERDKERYSKGRSRDMDRDLEDERDPGLRRERAYLRRPETQRRASSHADIDRERDPPEWDSRDLHGDHGRDRARPRDDRRKWRSRGSVDENLASAAAGIAGRRMQAEAAYT